MANTNLPSSFVKTYRHTGDILAFQRLNPGDVFLVIDDPDGNICLERLEVEEILQRVDTFSITRSDGVVVHIDLNRARIIFDANEDNAKTLTKTELALLRTLIVWKDRAMTYAQLLHSTWGPEYVNDLQYLRVWISRIREKLGGHPNEIISTVTGVGYVLNSRVESATQFRPRATKSWDTDKPERTDEAALAEVEQAL